nr:cyclic-phosphate processing receiver domain-containing protein [Paenibacillus shirakamiensis]
MDDLRRCPDGFTLTRSGEECLDILRATSVDILSLDFDMGPDQMTGGEVASIMAQEGLFAKEIFLHSSSLQGKTKMYEILFQVKPDEVELYIDPVPFDRLDEIALLHAKSKLENTR